MDLGIEKGRRKRKKL